MAEILDAPHTDKYYQIFDYLSTPTMDGNSPETAVVFGRNDPRVAYAAGDLILASSVKAAVITGGAGKDTGDLLKRGYRSEAQFLYTVLDAIAYRESHDLPPIYLEERAIHGIENARFALGILLQCGHIDATTSGITAVAHATSARRLGATIQKQGQELLRNPDFTVSIKPSDYRQDFDPQSPTDREEAARELKLLARWPEYGILSPQNDLPQDLLDFVYDTHGEQTPKPPSELASAVLRVIPPRLRVALLEQFAK